MSRSVGLDAAAIAASAGLATIVGVAVLAALFMISQPPRLRNREVELQSQILTAQDLAGHPGTAGAYPLGALCSGPLDPALRALSPRLRAEAASSGVTLAELSAVPATRDLKRVHVEAASVQLDIHGSYGAVLDFLGRETSARPSLFVDTLDLKPDASKFEAVLKGRVICSASPDR
jgi:hypothetical protein